MTGLALAKQLMSPEKRQVLATKLEQETRQLQARGPKRYQAQVDGAVAVRRSPVAPLEEVPAPPDLRLHVIRDYDLDAILRYINPAMLYTRHLGFKGKFEAALAAGDSKARELRERVAAVEAVMLARPDISAKAVYRFLPAHSDGDRLRIYASDGRTVLETFHFGRQSVEPYLCLADFTLPADAGRRDYVCCFATTVGPGVRHLAERWKEHGEYLKSHVLQVLALEGAEAFAELLHQKIRQMWGFPDSPDLTMSDLFKAHYRGVRVSFGYPACPRLEDQEKLFRLLDVEQQIGVHLTDGYMMEPEGSVSAVVFHHPQAKYFSLSPEDLERLEREIDRETEAQRAAVTRPGATT
jgi:5-methyltetrahydrofolate--homocysteine methyltransferase